MHESDLIRPNLTIGCFFGVLLNIITIKDNTLFPGLNGGGREKDKFQGLISSYIIIVQIRIRGYRILRTSITQYMYIWVKIIL